MLKLTKNKKLLLELSALLIIFILAFWIRAVNIIPDRILSYDPVYQYRFTKYFVDWGVFPAWDELSYYVGRAFYMPPLMYYLTALIYWFLNLFSSFSLKTVCSYAGAFYGALITISAYLLGRELSNWKGGLLAGALVGFAPQILTRTFGASYDTDQLVLFFILLTLWSSIKLFKKPSYFNFVLALFSFTAFMFTWQMFWYTFYLFTFSIIILIFFNYKSMNLKDIRNYFIPPLALFVLLSIIGEVNNLNPLRWFFAVISFALHPEVWIVNVSIAELQPVGGLVMAVLIPFLLSFSLSYYFRKKKIKLNQVEFFGVIFASTSLSFISVPALSYISSAKQFSFAGLISYISSSLLYGSGHVSQFIGNFTTGEFILDFFILCLLFSSALFYLFRFLYYGEYKAHNFAFSLALWLFLFFTIKGGIRFTEYVSAISLCLAAAGISILKINNEFIRILKNGAILILLFVSLSCGIYLGYRVGADVNSNWDNTWSFLKEKTPELALVGTWWDPGHMITGYAERRVIADGAHCGFDCMYTINDRITDLGKIFVTSDEKEALRLLRKYQGTSPEIYWIASFDLIGKFQWLQYFGTGCDARVEWNKCPLYGMFQVKNAYTYKLATGGEIYLFDYGQIKVLYLGYPIPFYAQGKNAVLFKEVLYYANSTVIELNFKQYNTTDIFTQLSPVFKALGYRLTKQFLDSSLWISEDKSVVVTIPTHLRGSLFTKMFFLEGKGLKNFELVYSNPEVKIYRVKNLEEGWKG